MGEVALFYSKEHQQMSSLAFCLADSEALSQFNLNEKCLNFKLNAFLCY